MGDYLVLDPMDEEDRGSDILDDVHVPEMVLDGVLSHLSKDAPE